MIKFRNQRALDLTKPGLFEAIRHSTSIYSIVVGVQFTLSTDDAKFSSASYRFEDNTIWLRYEIPSGRQLVVINASDFSDEKYSITLPANYGVVSIQDDVFIAQDGPRDFFAFDGNAQLITSYTRPYYEFGLIRKDLSDFCSIGFYYDNTARSFIEIGDNPDRTAPVCARTNQGLGVSVDGALLSSKGFYEDGARFFFERGGTKRVIESGNRPYFTSFGWVSMEDYQVFSKFDLVGNFIESIAVEPLIELNPTERFTIFRDDYVENDALVVTIFNRDNKLVRYRIIDLSLSQ